MKIENLKAFITVARTGNTYKAAERLYTSHQNLSFVIKNMEKELGITLFNRDNKGMYLTDDGKAFLAIVEPFFEQYNGFIMERKQNDKMPIFQIYTTPLLANYINALPEFIFSDEYYVSIGKRNQNELETMLSNNQPGIYLIPHHKNSLPGIVAGKTSVLLAKDKSIWICHKDNPIAKEKPVSVEKILQMPMITNAYLGENREKQMKINVDDISIGQKFMREKNFCFSTTQLFYSMDFADSDEWVVLTENDQVIIEYHLLFNIPSKQVDLAKQLLLPKLRTFFNVLK